MIALCSFFLPEHYLFLRFYMLKYTQTLNRNEGDSIV